MILMAQLPGTVDIVRRPSETRFDYVRILDSGEPWRNNQLQLQASRSDGVSSNSTSGSKVTTSLCIAVEIQISLIDYIWNNNFGIGFGILNLQTIIVGFECQYLPFVSTAPYFGAETVGHLRVYELV